MASRIQLDNVWQDKHNEMLFRVINRCQTVLLFWLFTCNLIATLHGEYRFDSWTAENGLPHNSIKAILQTRDGYLWMTTDRGLTRFDGVRFRSFSANDTPGIASDRYSGNTLLEDRQGNLWAGTMASGLLRYHYGTFQSFDSSNGLPDNRVMRIDEAPDGTVWIFTQRGLAKWSDGRLVRVAPVPGSPFNEHLTPQKIHMGEDSQFYGLWRFNGNHWWRFAFGEWSILPLPTQIAPERLAVSSIVEDSQRRLWFNVLNRPGEYYCVERGHLTTYTGFQKDTFVSYQDKRGAIWIGNHNGQNSVIRNGHREVVSDIVTPKIVRAIEDREGDLWIATQTAGLYRLKKQVVSTIRHRGPPEIQGLLLKDRKGRIWIGSLGLEQYSAPGAPILRINTKRWNPNFVTALYEDVDGILIAGFREGVARFLGGKFSEDPRFAQIQNGVYAILRDSHGDLWLGSDNGLFRVRAGNVKRYTTQEGLAGDSVTAISESADGTLWIATTSGLSYSANGRFSLLRNGRGNVLRDLTLLYQSKDGALWIGSDGHGLFRWKNKALTAYSARIGLGADAVFQILEDDLGYFWITSRTGLLRVPKHELDDYAAGKRPRVRSTRFGRDDGFLNSDFQSGGQTAALKGKNGELWFAAAGGQVAVVNSSAASVQQPRPKALIEECLVDRVAVACPPLVRLQPKQSNLEITYTALGSSKPDQFGFKYKMEGLDNDWMNVGSRRVAYYSHPPPGDYVFRVVAANSDGEWNPEESTLRVMVESAFIRPHCFGPL